MPRAHAPTAPKPAGRRRWIVAIAVLLLLGGYAAALTWVGRRLETDVQKSIHPMPAMLTDQRAAD